MPNRLRLLLLIIAGLGAIGLAAVTTLRIVAPHALAWTDALAPTLLGRIGGETLELVAGLGGALGALAVVLTAAARRTDAATAPIRIGALLAAAAVAVGTPGGVIPAAGYTFVLVVVSGVVVSLALLAIRHPLLGIPLAGVVLTLVVVAIVTLQGSGFFQSFVDTLAVFLPSMLLSLTHVITAAGLVAWSLSDRASAHGGFARWVLRHRIAITVIAAACALPYTLARASWLTPWPVLGGSADLFAESPATFATGLLLGSAMLTGGVLTLGLVLPWGERFPRWMAGLGGRVVPAPLAILPASLVAVLFTAGGAEFVLEGVGSDRGVSGTLQLMATFPFWLWGPLLGLSTWAYAMRRASLASATRERRLVDASQP